MWKFSASICELHLCHITESSLITMIQVLQNRSAQARLHLDGAVLLFSQAGCVRQWQRQGLRRGTGMQEKNGEIRTRANFLWLLCTWRSLEFPSGLGEPTNLGIEWQSVFMALGERLWMPLFWGEEMVSHVLPLPAAPGEFLQALRLQNKTSLWDLILLQVSVSCLCGWKDWRGKNLAYDFYSLVFPSYLCPLEVRFQGDLIMEIKCRHTEFFKNLESNALHN